MLKHFEIKDIVMKLPSHSVIRTNILEFFIFSEENFTSAVRRDTQMVMTQKVSLYYNLNFQKAGNRKEKSILSNT